MKSQLNKEKFASLTDEQMNQISGGDWKYTFMGYQTQIDGVSINTLYSRQRTFLGIKIGDSESVTVVDATKSSTDEFYINSTLNP